MSVLDAIMGRRNIKAFKPDAISEQHVQSWLTAASYAPNHRMTEPWRVLIVGPETRGLLKHKTDFGGAPVVIAILSKSGATTLERDENVMATACFMQNFMLAAQEAGVGTFWSSLGAAAHNREILGAAESEDVIGVFGIGYPAEIPALKPRTPIEDKITSLP
ncbi:nitroreductase family protein [Paenibacillus senegalimassiliensis]|uniref:nitroreductase family protein n=1 Tax=Paenibacillus senegalimassiliensis TaxID=1737426 RepID=UPI00073E49A9|nr:nitroreductase family protein [Paenibacillus senegalimassiliensis]